MASNKKRKKVANLVNRGKKGPAGARDGDRRHKASMQQVQKDVRAKDALEKLAAEAWQAGLPDEEE